MMSTNACVDFQDSHGSNHYYLFFLGWYLTKKMIAVVHLIQHHQGQIIDLEWWIYLPYKLQQKHLK